MAKKIKDAKMENIKEKAEQVKAQKSAKKDVKKGNTKNKVQKKKNDVKKGNTAKKSVKGKIGKAQEVKSMIIKLAKEGKSTRTGIQLKVLKAFPEYAKSTISAYISDSFNVKYVNKSGCGVLLKKNKDLIVLA